MKKSISIALTVILLLSLGLTACADSGSGSEATTPPADSGTADSGAADDGTGETPAPSGDAVEVTFWTLNTRMNAVDPIAEAFNAANPDVNVTVAYYDTDGIKDACKIASSSNTLPHMWFNWGGSLGGFYAENGLTYDLTAYAAENNWDQKFNAGALALCTLDGKLSGYPTSYNALAIYYRKDIFAENNLEVPTTFDEFEQLCADLKALGITPISTGGLYGWHTMRFVELLIEHYAGADLHDSMNTFQESYNNESVIQALTKYQEYCDNGYFPVGFLTADPNDTQMAVYSGQAAMDVQGQWYDGKIIQDEQDMDNFGVFAFPSGGSNRLSAFAEMTQFNVNLSDEELEACIRFMDYYYDPDVAAQYAEYYNMPLPTVGAEMPEGQPNVPVIMEMSGVNGTFTITDQAFPTEVADALFDVQDGIANGQMTPEEGAAKIQEAIEAYNS